MKITDSIVNLGSPITQLSPDMEMGEVWHHYNKPLSFEFSFKGDKGRFIAEHIQTFQDDRELWIIIEYEGEFDGIVFETPYEMHQTMMLLIAGKAHRVLIVDGSDNGGDVVISDKYYVTRSYPYSVFSELYAANYQA